MENMVTVDEIRKNYCGRRVFVTGHTGFKGAWLIKLLKLFGAEVTGYSLEPKNIDDLYYLISGDSICNSVVGDIRNKGKLTQTILEFEPDFIFHLAAQPLVKLSYETPVETFEVNVLGTTNLLDAVRLLPKKCCVVLITTDKVYNNNEWIYPYRETDCLGGYDPYSSSKACAELVIESYKKSFFSSENYKVHAKGIAVARAGNVIGGGDWSNDRLIPDIAKALRNNEIISVRNPLSIRPWQHVLEPLLGYLLLGFRLSEDSISFSQPFNFGPYADDALQVREIVELAIRSWGNGNYEEVELVNQPHEAASLRLDISKAIGRLGWRPKLSALEAVDASIKWYKIFFTKKESIDEFTTEQINAYLNKG